MSHFAELDKDNIVIRVLVGDNSLPDEGKSWFEENLGGRWVQTSYNAKFRKKFAGVGDKYDEEVDAFISPKSYDSWVFNEEKWAWVPPVPKPEDGKLYAWDEPSVSWIEISPEEGTSEITAETSE